MNRHLTSALVNTALVLVFASSRCDVDGFSHAPNGYGLSTHSYKQYRYIRIKHELQMTFTDATIGSSGNSPEEIAKQLRQRARELRIEAMVEEQSLKRAVELKREQDNREADGWIDLLLGTVAAGENTEGSNLSESAADEMNPMQKTLSSHTIALRIKDHNLLSMSKLKKIVERLHDRETAMLIGPEAILSKPETDPSGNFVIGDYNNSIEQKADENQKIAGLLDCLLEAVQLVDDEGAQKRLAPGLRIRVTELRQSREALLKQRVDGLIQSSQYSDAGDSLDSLARSSMQTEDDIDKKKDKKRQEKIMKRLIETPAWLPSSLATFAATSPVEVSISTWKMIKSDLLTGGDFICTSWDATDVAAVFRGRISRQIRDSEDNDRDHKMESIFNKVLRRLEVHSVLKEKVQLFLVEDNEYDKEETNPHPVIIAVSKEVTPEKESDRGLGIKALAAFSTFTTILTSLGYALSSFALNPGFFNAIVNENDVSLVPICLPIFFGVLAMSVLHEVGHYVAAQKYGIKLGWPVPLPSFQVGSFGCITPFRSFPSNRTATFDVAMSGPGITMIVSIVIIIVGLKLTSVASTFGSFPLIPCAGLHSSFLIGSIASLVVPKAMLAPLSQPIPVHPLFMIGLAGLMMSAVNMLPFGRLDGGRAANSIFGRQRAHVLSFLTLLFMAFTILSSSNDVITSWGAVIVLTQRLPDIPAIDEFNGVDRPRLYTYICSWTLGEFREKLFLSIYSYEV